jgi:DNA recombination protein RmuC
MALNLVIVGLLFAIVLLLAYLIYLNLYRKPTDPKDIELAMSKVWRESGLDERLGQISTQAQEIQTLHRSIEQMLRVPKERAAMGELSLELILQDQLPPDKFGIRKRALNGHIPDAYIDSTVGRICIDSKFPLDNYKRMIDTQIDDARVAFKRRFLRDVKGHLEKVAGSYVLPEEGSAEFAFVYIPSEAIYYFLVTEAYQLLQTYTQRGVQVVSPLTLAHKLQLIRMGVYAERLSSETRQLKADLLRLETHFQHLDRLWEVFYRQHFRNALNKAREFELAYDVLRQEFEEMTRLTRESEPRK